MGRVSNNQENGAPNTFFLKKVISTVTLVQNEK